MRIGKQGRQVSRRAMYDTPKPPPSVWWTGVPLWRRRSFVAVRRANTTPTRTRKPGCNERTDWTTSLVDVVLRAAARPAPDEGRGSAARACIAAFILSHPPGQHVKIGRAHV